MHEAGDEYWLQYDLNPSKTSAIYVDTSPNDGTTAMEGKLRKHVEDKTPRKNFKCDPNATMESFTRCAFNEIEDYECTPAINKIGGYFNETNICKTLEELNNNKHLINSQLSKTLYSQSSNSSCIKPCKTASFEVSLQKRHDNGKLLGNAKVKEFQTAGKFVLNFRYDEIVIENKKEYFVMSGDGLISAIGGFLGLFLGYSLVSVIEWISQLLKKCWK